MNKLMILLIGALLITLVAASAGVGSIDNECQKNGFDFGIAKFEWEDGEFKLEDSISGYTIDVSGDDETAYWTADPAVDGVLSKESTETYTYSGGTSGSVDAGEHAISHLTFCGFGEPIPEFGTITAGLALAGAALGYMRIRKKRTL